MFSQSFRFIVSIAAAALAICLVTGCGGGDQPDPAPTTSLTANGDSAVTPGDSAAPSTPGSGTRGTESVPVTQQNLYPEVVFTTSEGTFKVKLNREKAPITVENFLKNYVDTDYYDNTIFHQIVKGFMALGGAYTAELEAKESRAEIFNEAHNELKNLRGTIAMSRDPAFPHTASNLFFFNLVDNPDLDHLGRDSSEDYGYCVFGEVVEGIDVLDRISQVPVENRESFPDLPTKTVLIQSVRQLR